MKRVKNVENAYISIWGAFIWGKPLFFIQKNPEMKFDEHFEQEQAQKHIC